MPSIKYKDSTTGNMLPVSVKVGDTLPVGFEGEIPNGSPIPLGWVQVPDGDLIVSPTEPSGNDRRKVWLLRGQNLFDKTKVNSTSGYLNADGTIVANPEFKVSEYIYIYNISSLIMNGNAGRSERICFYDSSKTFISSFSTLTNTKMSIGIPSTAYYMRATVENNKLDNYQLIPNDEEYILENNIYEKFAPKSEEIYSTEEIRIGTWIDGKPIYRQVITGTKNHNDTLVSDVSELINSYGTGSSGYNKRTLPYYEYYNNTKYAINVYQNGSNIKTEIALGSNSSTSINVTLEYTKTTD